MITHCRNERAEFARFPNLLDAGRLCRFLRAVHMSGPGFESRITMRKKKYLRHLRIARQQYQGRAFLFQVRKVIKIVLLTKLVVDVVGVNARLSAEENQDGVGSDSIGNMFAARREFPDTLRIIKRRSWWGNSDNRWRIFLRLTIGKDSRLTIEAESHRNQRRCQ